jgi:hypothetical protein
MSSPDARSPNAWSATAANHWRRYRLVYVCVGVAFGLALVNRWAGAQNASRAPWIDATSARTGQTYVVHAVVTDGALQAFTLEAGDSYRFGECPLPAPGHSVACRDLTGQAWTIEP